MKIKFFDNSDFDPKIEKFSMTEYYYLLQLSGVLAYSRGKWLWFSIFHILFFFIMIIIVISMIGCAAYKLKDYQLSLAALSAHVCVGFVASIVILVNINFNRSTFVSLLTLIEKGYYDYGDNIKYKEVIDLKLDLKNHQRKLAIFLPIYFSLVGISAMAQPLIDSYQGTTLNVSFVNNVYMDMPQPLCLPWRTENEYLEKYGWFLFEIIEDTIIMLEICSGIMIIIKSTFSLAVELKILLHSIKNIEQRSLHYCQIKYPKFVRPISEKKLYENPLFLNAYEYCMKQNFEHFNVIRVSVKHLDRLQRWPMFCAIFVLSVVLACAVLTLIKGDTRIAPQLLSTLLLFMEAMATAYICKGGEEISILSDEVFSSFYKTKWMFCTERIKKSMIIMQECSKKPLCIKAGGFTQINWELFTKVMNSAYTYFNLMYAMDNK